MVKRPASISPKAIKVSITELSIGMYVCHLDRDWIETPFIFQGFIIETIEDINTLEEYCQYVWVESVDKNSASLDRLVILNSTSDQPSYAEKKTLPKDYQKANRIFHQSRKITSTLLDNVRLSGVVDLKAAKATVENCLSGILSNASAMLWMSKIRDQDHYTAEHSLNVCVLAITFGRQLGMNKDELFNLGLCGLLHDVGKMKVPLEILNKPGPLTAEEWKVMKGHSIFGRNLLMKSKDLSQTVDTAYSHHERIDGKGYPRGVKGDKVSRVAKIVAIVDAFDAMTAKRCYSNGITPSAAVKNIFKDKGTHFDERLSLQFIKTIGLYPPGTIVELVNCSLAIVLESHHRYRHLPKVLLVDIFEDERENEKIIDLSLIEQGELGREFLIKTDHPDGYLGVELKNYKEFLLASK